MAPPIIQAPRSVSALFGYCLDILLYGILTVQLYIYYLSFPNDRRMTKATAAFVYVVGTLQTAFALQDFYAIFCAPDYDFSAASFHTFGFMWITIPLSGASVAAVSQLLYAHRIHVLSGKKVIAGVVTTLAFLQLTVGIFVALASYKNLMPISLLDGAAGVLDQYAWESFGAICDLVITIYMFHFLSRNIRRSFRPTQVSLARIKRLTLETGLLTTGVAMAYIVLSLSTYDSFIIPGLALSKVYGNSILALLNGRLRIPGGRNEIDSDCVVEHFAGMSERQPDSESLRDQPRPSSVPV